MALLTEDKISHLSHVILNCLKNTSLVQLKGEEEGALREIKRVLLSELAEEETIDRAVRGRLASYARPPIEGSSEWEVLYRKLLEEEQRRRRKP
jgi:hypothetical protein